MEDWELQEAMAEYAASRPQPPKGLSFEEFLAWGDEDTWAEWVDGEVIVLAPASAPHQLIKKFLVKIMDEFAHHHQSGEVFDAPFAVHLPRHLRRVREPDILFVRREHLFSLHDNYFEGSPDVIVEVVSPDSRTRDYRDKYGEYEAAGVGEYWLVDPRRRRITFFRLGGDGRFHQETPDDQGVFRSEAFPGFWFNAAWLWRDPLPSVEVYGKGKRDAAREFLGVRFGEQAADIQAKLEEITDPDAVDGVIRELFAVSTLEDAWNVIDKGLRLQRSPGGIQVDGTGSG
ncbi:MAG: Uma2 family endonuclease [Peptococcaceae bacterium]|jgi:Uma2 family endonuclease|nr:Uma2 family endonuclease [Peptococcaceae bacterium]